MAEAFEILTGFVDVGVHVAILIGFWEFAREGDVAGLIVTNLVDAGAEGGVKEGFGSLFLALFEFVAFDDVVEVFLEELMGGFGGVLESDVDGERLLVFDL